MDLEQCEECKTYGNGCNGVKLNIPGYAAGSVSIDCKLFAQKTTPVDPGLTQDSTCGECEHWHEATNTQQLNYCGARSGITRFAAYVACVKFKSKTTRIKAKDCPHRMASVAIGENACGRNATFGACIVVSGEACEEGQP